MEFSREEAAEQRRIKLGEKRWGRLVHSGFGPKSGDETSLRPSEWYQIESSMSPWQRGTSAAIILDCVVAETDVSLRIYFIASDRAQSNPRPVPALHPDQR